jgi:hypothetical protein
MSERPIGGQNPDDEPPPRVTHGGDPEITAGWLGAPTPPGNGSPAAVRGFGFKFDGWDVFLAGAVFCLVVGAFVHDIRVILFWVAGGLGILWIIATILATLGVIPSKRGPS